MVCTCGPTRELSCKMLKEASFLTPPTPARGSTELAEVQDAPFRGQGRIFRLTLVSRFTPPRSDARTMLADFFSILLKLTEVGCIQRLI